METKPYSQSPVAKGQFLAKSWHAGLKHQFCVQLFYRSHRIILDEVPGLGDLGQGQAEVKPHAVL